MKKVSFIFTVILLIINSLSFAQNQDSLVKKSDKDTTKIKMGDKEIIIIGKREESVSKEKAIEKSKLEFRVKIQALQLQRDSLKKQGKSPENEDKIKDLDAQISALQKGAIDLDREIHEKRKKDHEFNRHKKSGFDGHWAGFEFGLNNFVDKNFALQMPAGSENLELKDSKSWELALNFYEYDFELVKNYVALVTGAGIQWNNYRFQKNISLIEDANGVIYGGNESSNPNFTKNTLNTTYLTVPLILEFHIPTDKKPINIGFGVVGGIKLFAKTKQKYETEGDSHRDVKRSDYQLSTFRYSGTFRIGYRGFQLYSNCSLVPLFKKDKGAEIYPFTVGFSISFN